MIVLSHPFFYDIKSSIKGKYISYVEYDNYTSIINGRSRSVCNSKYRFSSCINGKGYSK